MATSQIEIIGRDQELLALTEFIAAREALPGALLLEGEAGIGKTMLWKATLPDAAECGYQVLRSSPTDVETSLPFSSVADLLGDVLEQGARELPAPQRRALEVALLLEEPAGPPVDQRAVSVALLGALRTLAADGPLLIAVDDVQWLDAASGLVLSFCVRRLREEPVAFVLARRAGSPGDPLHLARTFEHTGLQILPVGPLSTGAVQRLLHERLGLAFPRPTLHRLYEACGGNPFYALEIGRAVLRRGGVEPGRPLQLPPRLEELVSERLEALAPETQRVLAMAAAVPHPTVSMLGAGAALDDAARAGLIELDGERVRFTHPLLRSAAYELVGVEGRARIHRQLAERVHDRSERARHRALSEDGPNAELAAALDAAAEEAANRGASDAAAEFASLALRLTPPTDDEAMLQRRFEAARRAEVACDLSAARKGFEELLADAPAGGFRARVLLRLGQVSADDFSVIANLLEQALREAAGDDELLSVIRSDLSVVALIQGDLTGARREAETALEHARKTGLPALLAEACTTLGIMDAGAGAPRSPEFWQDALAYDRQADLVTYYPPSVGYGLQLMWADRLDEARELMQAALRRAVANGWEEAAGIARFHLIEVEARGGRWADASRHAGELEELYLGQSGQEQSQAMTLYAKALLATLLGREAEARVAAENGIALAEAVGDTIFLFQNHATLGLLELSLGRAAEADVRLRPLWPRLTAMGYGEPSAYGVLPNAAEALIQLGELDLAQDFITELADRGRALDSPWSLALAARCRGLLAAAEGDLDRAEAEMQAALAEHERMPGPFERGRTLLALGAVRRRRKQKRAARDALEEALAVFEELGAKIWAERARGELARISGRGRSSVLTATEQRVVDLVVDGRSNKEVANALFVSVRAVEANLTRIYAKLGIRSRAELIRRAGNASDTEG